MTGTIEGTVTDGAGDSLADATVTITDSATDSVEVETRTDTNGDYSVTVDADTYDVRAEKLQYESDEETQVNVGNNETVTVDLTLQALEPKVIGELTGNTGIGVVGRVDVSEGIPIGIKAQVGSSEGYGIYTPDDAVIGGTIDTNETDFVVEAGTQSTRQAQNVVLGHASNAVTDGAVGATISGGGYDSGSTDWSNEVTADYGTVGGGRRNTAGGILGTVAGGWRNTASDTYGTVAGGSNNTASGTYGTVAGGDSNTASSKYGTVAGGNDNTASGYSATVAGGKDNTASGSYSFAAGRFAEAGHEGTFVWADSDISIFSSTGADQFLVEADGGMGVGTDAPGSQLHVTDTLAEDNTDPSGHVATIENESDSGSADVLLLQTGETDPGGTNKYVTFADANGAIGAIQGNSNGGIEYNSSSADIAEYFPAATPDAEFDTGSVVGLADGEIRRDPTAADAALVVSDAPMLTGNVPDYGEAETAEQSVCVALLGQVPVRIGAAVSAGDLLVATADGTAVPADTQDGCPPVVGRALEDGAADDTVTTFVNARAETDRATLMQDLDQRLQETVDAVQADNDALRERAEDLEAENQRLQETVDALRERTGNLEAENEQLRERLDAVTDRLASLEAGPAEHAPADD